MFLGVDLPSVEGFLGAFFGPFFEVFSSVKSVKKGGGRGVQGVFGGGPKRVIFGVFCVFFRFGDQEGTNVIIMCVHDHNSVTTVRS